MSMLRFFINALSRYGEVSPPPPSGALEVVSGLQLVSNVHRYNKFPQPTSFSDGELFTSFSSATTHTENGWLMVGNSRNGGVSFDLRRPFINGVQPDTVCTNVEIFDDVVYLFYQDGINYTQCKLAKSYDRGYTWTYLGEFIFAEPIAQPGTLCQFGTSKPKKLPEGTIIIPYYAFPADPATETCTVGLLKVVGDVIQQGPIIDQTIGTVFPNNAKHETLLCITEVGATDSTTKIVALSRSFLANGGIGHQFWYHSRSSDGGATWTKDTTNLTGYNFGTSHVPIMGAFYNGLWHLFIGTRNFVSGNIVNKIGYITVSSVDLFNNYQPGYSAVTWIYEDVLAEQYSGEVDFGYVEVDVQKTFNKLWIHWYGASPDSPSNSTGYPWLSIKQLKVFP